MMIEGANSASSVRDATTDNAGIIEYQHESVYGTDYYCPRCWNERQTLILMGDVVEKQGRNKEVFIGFYCEYCQDKLNDSTVYNPVTGNLEGYEVGGTLGYPED